MEILNELQQAELEAASTLLQNLSTKIADFKILLDSLETDVNTKLVVLDTLHQSDIDKIGQTLNGNYFFGDEVVIDSSSKSAHVIFGPSSHLEVRSIPKLAYDVVPKAYVDNILSPISLQLNRVLSDRNTVFLTLRRSGSGSSLALTSGDLISSSSTYESAFTLGSQQITVLLSGTYQISWNLESSDFSDLMTALLKLDGVEIGKLNLYSTDSGTINLALHIDNGSIISWSGSNTSFADLSNTLSIVRLGD